MTSFNDLDGFLRALEQNPQWKEAVRALILGEELLQLPVQFIAFVGRVSAFIDQTEAFIGEQRQFNERMDTFVGEQKQFNERMDTFVGEQKQFNAEQKQFNTEQKQFNQRMETFVSEQKQFNAEQREFNEAFVRRLNRIEGDVGTFRAYFAQNKLHGDATGIAMELGLEYVRIVSQEELTQMTRGAVGRIPINELRSFRRADLVIEATDGSSTHYILVEASYTADQRDTDRAQRNARFLTEFTGRTAHAVISSVRNDHYAEQQINSGAVYWLPLDDRGPEPVE